MQALLLLMGARMLLLLLGVHAAAGTAGCVHAAAAAACCAHAAAATDGVMVI
jgi:hypothetical protein